MCDAATWLVMTDMMPGMFGMMTLAVLFWALVVVAVAAGVWALLRRTGQATPDAGLTALRERYARGEISREEYEARRRELAA